MIIYNKWLNSSIWCIDGALTGITDPGQSGLGSNGKTPRLKPCYQT